jgi:hypothetical protein
VTTSGRLPDFLIPGVQKAGSTTLYRWLSERPDVHMPVKEPNFFCDDDVHRRGLDWYRSLFHDASPGQTIGEASVECLAPGRGELAASRIATEIPHAKLVVVLREPIERMRSHYRHEVQKGREARTLLEALQDPACRYREQSCYYRCLEPYLERFPREQLCLVRSEDLIRPGSGASERVLAHLGLSAAPPPSAAANVTAEKAPTRPMIRWLWDRGWAARLEPVAQRLPRGLRRVARPLMVRGADDYAKRLAHSAVDVPTELLDAIATDRARLHRHLGISWP